MRTRAAWTGKSCTTCETTSTRSQRTCAPPSNAGQANYSAAKAGLIGLSKALARELASRSITVNVVAPGYIRTAMTDELPESAKKELKQSIPLNRLGEVEDVAACVVFLASEEAGYVTGHVLNISGGLYI